MPDLATREDEVLLLDLLNSTPVLNGVPQDLLVVDGGPAPWVQEQGGPGSAAEVAHLRLLRDTLQAVVRGDERPEALRPFLTGVHLLPTIHSGGLGWRLAVDDDRRLAARALVAWGRVQETMPGRLRPCANEECRLFLLDRSKPNTARWCSMKVCGNRMKARRHYERARRID
ncbi:CGNR zinc finger domain-containing protein [Pseudonocardia dioxanivorans]|nr:CGNR zinc finger domain-containing protein [Pseudonocardia dioxanivorans]